jgi:diaminopimelate decarboxylase
VAEGPIVHARDARGVLSIGGVPLDHVLAAAGAATPAYVYDLDAIVERTRSLVAAVGERGLCAYAIKANAARPIVESIVACGAGVDVVSGGELMLALEANAPADRIVFSGVAKRDREIDLALARRIRALHVESVEELPRIAARARAIGVRAPVCLRINPEVEADTHAHIATGHDEAKFGIVAADLPAALAAIDASTSLALVGLSVHVGSQLMSPEPYLAGVDALASVATALMGQSRTLEYLDCGGGFGVPYRDDQRAVEPADTVRAARARLAERGLGALPVVVEPGRALVAAAGVIVASVIQPKVSGERRWLFVDAGMNDLLRPALYQAFHRIEPLLDEGGERVAFRVAGPVCESSDDFGVHRLPKSPPEHVVICEAGAYGRSMASTYNQRAIAAELVVTNGRVLRV